jgi:hypothetical protein
MNGIPLLEQKLCQIGAVLAADAGDEGRSHGGVVS